MRKIFIITIFILSFSIVAKAQQVPDYLFLEVLDSKGQPVSKAEVQTIKGDFNPLEKDFTNEKGSLGFYLPWRAHYEDLTSFFTVIKDGYFTYHDFGGSSRRGRSEAKIELLKVPQTKAEKQNLGNEQLKREFMWAAKTGDAETLKNLLKKSINPNLTTTDLRGVSGRKDVPAIQFAALSANAETVEALIKAGVKIKKEEEPFRSILQTYLKSDPFFWHKPKDEKERSEMLKRFENGVNILLKAGADYNSNSDRDTRTPIMIAAEKGYLHAVQFLLEKGVPVNGIDHYQQTLLRYAAEGDEDGKTSKIKMVEFLLRKGADPNENCAAGLRNASRRGDVQIVQALLKYGVKVNQPTVCWSSLGIAVSHRKTAVAKILIEAGADIDIFYLNDGNFLTIAARNNDLETIRLLIEKGALINAKDFNGRTALFFGILSNSNPELIKILLKAGANPNVIVQGDSNGYCLTMLMLVASPNKLGILKLLLENGANTNLACANGNTVLLNAIKEQYPEVVKVLIEYGANPNGELIDKAMNLAKSVYKEDSSQGKKVSEIIKIIEEARLKEKILNN